MWLSWHHDYVMINGWLMKFEKTLWRTISSIGHWKDTERFRKKAFSLQKIKSIENTTIEDKLNICILI